MSAQQPDLPIDDQFLSTSALISVYQPFEQKVGLKDSHSSFTFLNNTLSNLNNDTLKRYHTNFEVDNSPVADSPFSQVKNHHPNNRYHDLSDHNSSSYLLPSETFAPQPWNNDVNYSLFATQAKAPLTQIRQRNYYGNSKLNTLHKSFHISKGTNRSKDRNKEHYKSVSSSFDYNCDDKKLQNGTLYGKSEKWKERLEELKNDSGKKSRAMFDNYNYTNEQKARVTLDHLVHKKKNSKLTRIIKMKTHNFDNALQKRQEKINHHSKNLIQALDKFSGDQVLRKSIDRAVDLLKKRTHNLIYYKNNSKSQLPKSFMDQTSMKWLSCHKIDVNREGFGNKQKNLSSNALRPKSRKNESPIINNVSLTDFNDYSLHNTTKTQNSMAIKQKCKISFKPKRTALVQTKNGGKKQPTQKLNHQSTATIGHSLKVGPNVSKTSDALKKMISFQKLAF